MLPSTQRTRDLPALFPAVASAVRAIAHRALGVLIVDEDQEHTASVRELLQRETLDSGAPGFVVSCVSTLAEALTRLGEDDLSRPRVERDVDTILLSLSLPEARGIPALAALRAHVGNLPIVVLVDPEDEVLAYRAVREGAADHLLRGQLHAAAVSRSLRYAAERQASRAALDDGNRALTRLLGNLPGIAYRCGTDGRCTLDFVSHGVEQITGRPAADFIGFRRRPPRVWFPRLVHPQDRARVWQTVRSAIAAREPYEFECRIVGSSGQRWLWGRGRGVVGDDGQVRSMEGFLADITERKQAEEAAEVSAHELAHKEMQLRQSQKLEAIGRLAGGIAHDFNNLLMVVLSNAEFVREGLAELALPLGQSGVEELEEIIAAGRRAASLTRQLLLFSRKQVVQPETLGLNDVLGDIESLLRRVIGADVLLVTVPDARHDVVRADRGQLEQIIMNLAVNARDAMPSGGTLTIETSTSVVGAQGECAAGLFVGNPLPPGEYLTLTVSDTGVGMDAATQASIFEPFFTTKAPGKGTGLGLATVYGIVAQLGGGICVRSAPDEGASFTIHLPQTTEPVVPALAARRRSEIRDLGRLPRGDELLLVVEDETAVRLTIRRLLERQGYRVLEAQHARDAVRLHAAHAGEIALVLTDVVMPGMSGDTLIDLLRQRTPDVRILVMSGYPGGVTPGHATDERPAIDGFLQKPISFESLLRTIRVTLDRGRGTGPRLV